MKKIKYLVLLVSINFLHSQSRNVGVNTETPDQSAILEVSADPLPTSSITTKKGLLLPQLALTSIVDVTTIPSPARGLLVFNTADSGTYPNQVTANKFYYWNGLTWERLVFTSVAEEAVKPRIFYIEGADTQIFTPAQINSIAGTAPSNNVVTFSGTSSINVKNIITFNASNSTFLVDVSGIYDVSTFVNYNPMTNAVGAGNGDRAFLNLKIQISTDNGITFTDSMGSRTGWGNRGGILKTAILQSTPLHLHQGDIIRVVILPYESYAAGRTQTMTFPVTVKSFAQNDLLRFIISKPTFANNYDTNSGNVVSVTGTDITKSFNLIRIQE